VFALRHPAESFGCQRLLGIHWRRRTLDATPGGEALLTMMASP
jgi:hypothetical protein